LDERYVALRNLAREKFRLPEEYFENDRWLKPIYDHLATELNSREVDRVYVDKVTKLVENNRTIPRPRDGREREIVNLLREYGHRLIASKILSALALKGIDRADSTTRGVLSNMVKAGILTKSKSKIKDPNGYPGYGLPEWEI
jgi:hypothetical protein